MSATNFNQTKGSPSSSNQRIFVKKLHKMDSPTSPPVYEIISQKIFNLTNEGFPNQQHWLNLDYLKVNGEYIPHSRAVVQHHMTTEGLSLIQLEYRWRKHFIDNMKPRFCKSLNKNSEMFNLGFCLICGLLTIKLRGWMWKWRSRGSTWCSTSWPKRGALWTLRSTGRKAMRNLVWILTINVKNVILPCQSCSSNKSHYDIFFIQIVMMKEWQSTMTK